MASGPFYRPAYIHHTCPSHGGQATTEYVREPAFYYLTTFACCDRAFVYALAAACGDRVFSRFFYSTQARARQYVSRVPRHRKGPKAFPDRPFWFDNVPAVLLKLDGTDYHDELAGADAPPPVAQVYPWEEFYAR